ncbi:MAG: hypothetical protein ACYDBV_07785 [Nitrospiria bacterium]
MKKILFLVHLFFPLIIFSPLVKAYSDGPYVSVDVGGYTRGITENCPKCVDPMTGLPILKVDGTANSTRLLAKFGVRTGLIDTYLTLGGASLSIDEFNGFSGQIAPLIGGGFKILMYRSPTWEHFTLYVNPDVFYYKTSDTLLIQSQSLGAVTENHDISWTEYAIRVGGSARYDMVEPYGGVELSFVNAQETGPVFGSADIRQQNILGYFLGGRYYLDPSGQVALFGEFGGGDTDYFKIGIQTKF